MAEGCEDQLRLWRCRVCSPRWSDYEAGQARFSGRGRFRMCSEFADRLFASCRDEEMTVAGGNCVKIGERWKTPKAFVQNALNVWYVSTEGDEGLRSTCFNGASRVRWTGTASLLLLIGLLVP